MTILTTVDTWLNEGTNLVSYNEKSMPNKGGRLTK